MAGRTRKVLALGCWLLLGSSLFAQAYNSADSVRNLYRKYLHREPTSNELTQWVWSFQKGLSLTEAQHTFLSSDEYFSRYARNSSSFITGLFTDVLNRPPTSEESLQWLHSLNVSQGDRKKLVRDFLKAAEGRTTTPAPAPRPDPVTPESQLVATAGLLHGAIEEELGGTQQGRQLSVMSRNLVNASRSLEKAKQISSALYDQATEDVRVAVAAIDQEMSRVYVSARSSSAYLNRYKQIFNALAPTTTKLAPLPLAQPPAADSVDAQLRDEYIQLSTVLLGDTNQVILLLRGPAVQNVTNNQLLRDVEFFRAQATAVQQSVSTGMLKQDLRHEVLRLRALAQGISRVVQQSGQVGRVAQRWEMVIEDLQDIFRLVGIGEGPAIDTGQPVLLNLPTYHQLPYQVQRPTAAQLSSRAIPITDQAIAHVDAFVTGFNHFLPLSPRVPALQAQARGLRVLLMQFRQELGGGATAPQAKARLDQINLSLQSLTGLWTLTVQERQLTNAPNLNGVAMSVQSLNQIFQGA